MELTANTLLKTINKQTDVTVIRNEVAALPNPIPQIVSKVDLNMMSYI